MSTTPEWQPIETAPKDGTDILALVHRLSNEYPPRVVIVSWREDDTAHEFAWLDHSHDDYALGFASTPFRPTHWMPLPEPPKE